MQRNGFSVWVPCHDRNCVSWVNLGGGRKHCTRKGSTGGKRVYLAFVIHSPPNRTPEKRS